MSGCARIDTVGGEASGCARKGLVDAGDEQLCSNGHGWVREERSGSGGRGGGGTQAVVLELTQLSGRQAAGLEGVWWKRETSGCAQMDTVGSEMSNIVFVIIVKRERARMMA